MVFSSFDGGGPSYNVIIEDQSILSYSSRIQYYKADHDLMTGAGYDEIMTFKGLKAGTTRMTIQARSPIAENYDELYSVTVDESLNVSMERINLVSEMLLERFGNTTKTYQIVRENMSHGLLKDYEFVGILKPETIVQLTELIKAQNIGSWNGFQRTDLELEDKIFYGEADGECFSLRIEFDDSSVIEAAGSNAFPENYDRFTEELDRLLSEAVL